MKAFLAVTSLDPAYGGPAFSISQLANALDAAGATIGVWSPDGTAANSPLLKGNVVRLSGEAKEAMQSFGAPDVLHDNGIWLAHNHRLAALAANSGVPRVVGTRGMLEPWAMRHKILKKTLAWHAYQRRDLARAKVLHATAQAEADHLAALKLGPAIEVVPNGIEFPASIGRRPVDDVRTALFLGRIYPVKGLPMLVRAWGAARPEGWRLVIAGPDEANHKLEVEAVIEAEGLTQVVSFVGPVSGQAKADIFAQADLFILPSFSESFGMAVGEALGHGLPVLTTKGAPWPQLESAGCGWWVDATVEGLASGLRSATAISREGLAGMGRRGRDLVERDFSWDSSASRMIALYDKVIAATRDRFQ